MASDTFAGRREEFVAALAVLTRQIRGLEKISCGEPAGADLVAMAQELGDRRRRRDLLLVGLAALTADDAALAALEADGYPDMPKGEVTAAVFAELQDLLADVQAAVSEFELIPPASNISVSLGEPAEKP